MDEATLIKLKTKFLSKIKIDNECWIWQGAFDKANNSVVRYINEQGVFKEISAKRLSLIINNCRLESSRIYVLNSCDNELCVNPAHLYQANAENRFWKSVNKTQDCWLWTASLNKYGYGKFSNKKDITAHRFSYILHNGKIPHDKIVRHTCDNPACVNPNHLILGTYLDNSFDKRDRNRFNSKRSIYNVLSKLKENDIIAIRSMYETRKFSYQALGKLFKVSTSTISKIVRKEIYKDI